MVMPSSFPIRRICPSKVNNGKRNLLLILNNRQAVTAVCVVRCRLLLIKEKKSPHH
jgi:hypothetical protein